jgi:hypothetical protein
VRSGDAENGEEDDDGYWEKGEGEDVKGSDTKEGWLLEERS